jgi:hypothetical protein
MILLEESTEQYCHWIQYTHEIRLIKMINQSWDDQVMLISENNIWGIF